MTNSRFYDLLLHGAAVIDDIRAEIKAVLRDHDGILSPQALAQMKLLDSAIKESQRMHPLGLSKIPLSVTPTQKNTAAGIADTVLRSQVHPLRTAAFQD